MSIFDGKNNDWVTPTGTTAQLFLNKRNYHALDLGSASGDVTVTLEQPVAPMVGNIVVKQGATARDITWSAASGSFTITWLGTEPTWNTDTSKTRVVSWMYWPGEALFLWSSETN
jgi:hypothetical protein